MTGENEPAALLVQKDRELGYAYVCPNCKTFWCTGTVCSKCGQAIDPSLPKVDYLGKIQWS